MAETDVPADTGTAGDCVAGADNAFAEVYQRLKALAARKLAAGPRGTLDTTALVHEMYLRLGDGRGPDRADQSRFFAYAARAMRNLLIDRARARMRLRAGGEWVKVTLNADQAELALDSAEQAVALEQALQQLEATDARAARVVELRYFAGLTLEQAAQTLGLTRRTVDRDWRFARAFLGTALQ